MIKTAKLICLVLAVSQGALSASAQPVIDTVVGKLEALGFQDVVAATTAFAVIRFS